MGILKRNGKKIFSFLTKENIFYPVLLLEIILFCFLNGKNEMMHGVLPYYQEFANYFISGFDQNYEFATQSETFPMWGFGLVLLAFSANGFVILVIQQLFSLITIFLTFNILRRLLVPEKTIKWIKVLLILFGFIWFIFHSALWPYSIAANLLILSVLYLSLGYKTNQYKYYFISAICYGVLLNFRSDYIYHFLAVAFMLIIHSFLYKKEGVFKGATWIVVVLLLMIPWGIHTKLKTGNFLLNSTNSGHVLYISLGQLPNNTWGITSEDGDPKMHAIVDNKYGIGTRTFMYEANQELKKAWKENIKEYPKEYAKKCIYNLYLTIVRPFTNGEIYKYFIDSVQKQEQLKNEIKKDISNKNFVLLLKKTFSSEYVGFMLPIFLNVVSIFLFIGFIILMIVGVFRFKTEIFRNWLILSLYMIISYQIALQTLAYYNPNYHTNVFIFYVILSSLILSRYKNGSEREHLYT